MTLRQKRMPCGTESRSSMIVAPVLVKPDIVSKKALDTSGTHPSKRNGSMPIRENSTQMTDTMMNPSFLPMDLVAFLPNR